MNCFARITRGLLSPILAAAASAAPGATCTIQSGGLAFGAYDSLSPAALDGAGDIRVDCDAETSFSVGLSSGSGVSGAREMTSGGDRLAYNVYTDASRTIAWGDGVTESNVSGSGTAVDLPIFGRIPPRQNVPAGQYGDTVVITVSY